MTYRVYIKKDYKPEIMWRENRPRYHLNSGFCLLVISAALLASAVLFFPRPESGAPSVVKQQLSLPGESQAPAIEIAEAGISLIEEPGPVETAPLEQVVELEPAWQKVAIRRGDNLSLIFDRLKLGPSQLYQVIHSGKDAALLKDIRPGQELELLIEEGKLESLRFEPGLTQRLEIKRDGEKFVSQLQQIELDSRSLVTQGSIDSSLFLAGQAAGLSDNLIMQLVSIFGWDIDFVLDIRRGDSFKVVFEELYREGEKVSDGAILAAEFRNQDRVLRAVRYTSPGGDTSYFNENGLSMRKAFLRTPLKFSRISSRFNLRRKHPVLNRIRAHRGVDYAAPTGTPIKATGDGKVILAGRKGGYGRTVIIKHGGTYKTLYAHMSSISRKVKSGSRVKQGQVIGYVGKSGLATGPHLHYEFQVNGVHRNPLTVKLPKAAGVARTDLEHFRKQSASLLAQLDTGQQFASNTATSRETSSAAKNNVLASKHLK